MALLKINSNLRGCFFNVVAGQYLVILKFVSRVPALTDLSTSALKGQLRFIFCFEKQCSPLQYHLGRPHMKYYDVVLSKGPFTHLRPLRTRDAANFFRIEVSMIESSGSKGSKDFDFSNCLYRKIRRRSNFRTC